MSTKDWLARATELEKEIKSMDIIRAELKETLYSTSVLNTEKVQTSRRNTRENKLAAYIDYCEKVDNKIDSLYKTKSEICDTISKVQNITYRTLLELRYLKNMSWEAVADIMHYSNKWVRTKLHSEALKEIGKFIK